MNSIQKASALSLIAGCSYYIYHKVFLMKYKQKMVMMNSWPFHDEVLRYICMKYGDEVNSFNYSVEKVYHFNEWRFRRKEKPVEFKVHMPNECDMKIIYKGKQIYVKYFMVKDNNNIPYKLMSQHDCQQDEEIVYQLELTADTKEILTEFADEAMEWCKNEKKKIKMNTKETMNVYYYKKDYWT